MSIDYFSNFREEERGEILRDKRSDCVDVLYKLQRRVARRLCVCFMCVPYVYALCVCLTCMPYVYAFYACRMWMPDTYALYVCLIRMPYMCLPRVHT